MKGEVNGATNHYLPMLTLPAGGLLVPISIYIPSAFPDDGAFVCKDIRWLSME